MAAARQYPIVATFAPEAFEVADERAARAFILTPEHGRTTEHRWATETPYLAALMGAWLAPKPGMLLLDYGCGIGRMAKALIEGFGCQVIGVDVSHSMRILAHAYVRSDRFTAVSPTILATLIERGLVCDAALSVWVLQHTARPADDMETMRRALKPGARITVVNTNFRSVPSREHGWGDDRVDVEALLRRHFAVGRIDKLSAEVLAPGAVEKSFIAELINDPPAIAHG